MGSVGRPSGLKAVRCWISDDFGKFLTGQVISSLGDAVSGFALPLLVFTLTGSALNLALTTTITMLPYLFFGLIIGAWVDRLDRKRVMIVVDLLCGAVIALLPILALIGQLSVGWIYGCAFVNAILSIFFDAAQFAAVAALVKQDDLVQANGRVQASYSAATIVGPFVGGAFLIVLPLYGLLWIDAASFVISAFSLSIIRVSFNRADPDKETKPRTSLRQDIIEGLRYVIGHPVLRNIALMMAMVNLVSTSVGAQLVFYAKNRLHASDTQVGWLFSAGSIGLVVLSLAAGRLRKRFSFSQVALGALTLNGLTIILLGLNTVYWLALPLWGLSLGLVLLFNINTGSLRQAIAPNHMLGRIIMSARVLAWSVIPIGTGLGGFVVEKTGRVDLLYLVIGLLVVIIPTAFRFSALGRAEKYLPPK